MTSVTRVLDYYTDPILLKWFLNKGKAACQKIGDDAKEIGTLVDKLVQDDIKGIDRRNDVIALIAGELSKSVFNCLIAWDDFKKTHPEFMPTVKEMQTELIQGELKAHPDFIIHRKDSWGVVDLKTSSAIRPNYWIQTCKYVDMAQNDVRRVYPRFVGVLRLDKESAKWEYVEFSEDAIVKETGEKFLDYNVRVFEAFYTTFTHGQIVREVLRQQLEDQICSTN